MVFHPGPLVSFTHTSCIYTIDLTNKDATAIPVGSKIGTGSDIPPERTNLSHFHYFCVYLLSNEVTVLNMQGTLTSYSIENIIAQAFS